ncbi:LuxR C-terminal-related transcriptional regulator [Arcticibacter sp.]|uniref:LuxR C-terminal-related transcriptional regulator n=1 Tax=Arcticibacter sp. TaxID=1872630 RepID=UPI0038906432
MLNHITYPDKIIADKLHISIRTVVNHSVSIRRKTGLRSKAEMTAYWMSHILSKN